MKYIAIVLAAVFMLASPAEAKHRHHHHRVHHVHSHTQRSITSHSARPVRHAVHRPSHGPVTYLTKPSVCPPVSFCGCGAAIEVFGQNVRRLWLAAEWFAFPRAQPAPGMVAVHPHHVFVLKYQIQDSVWMVADYNSGGHLSRLHPKDIRGWTIVNPRSGGHHDKHDQTFAWRA